MSATQTVIDVNGVAGLDDEATGGKNIIIISSGKESIAEAPVPIIDFPTRLTGIKKTVYRGLVGSIRELYAREGLVSNFVDMMKELNSGGMVVKTVKEYRPVFQAFHDLVNEGVIDKETGVDALRNKFDHAMWTSSIFVSLITKGPVKVTLGDEEKTVKSFIMPTEITIIDPMLLDFDEVSITGNIYYEPGKKFINSIKTYYLGVDKHPFVLMYPDGKRKKGDPPNVWRRGDIVELFTGKGKGVSRIPLPVQNMMVTRWTNDDTETYPLPYLVRTFDAVNDKRLLRNGDRSILTKMINAILHIQVGSGVPNKPATDGQLKQVVNQQQNFVDSDPSRMQVSVTGDNVEYKWVVMSDTAMLQQEHYRVINYELLSCLLGLVANMLLADNGTIDISLINKVLQGKNDLITSKWKKYLESIYNMIIVDNNLENVVPKGGVKVRSKRISTFETDAFKTMISNGVKSGFLPALTYIDEVGEDYESVVEALKDEQALREAFQIFIGFPAYNQVFTKITDGNVTVENDLSTPSDGRPAGAPEDPSADTKPKTKKKKGS